jgi:hypothetical protein
MDHCMPPNLLRLAYIFEFLIALIAILVLWTQAGGQVHLDIMPWYFKLFLSLAASLAIVKATEASVSRERPLNSLSILWLILLIFLVIGMAGVTYYYHLQEDNTDEEGNDLAVLIVSPAHRPVA